MSYACFVKDVYECIKRYSADDAFSLSAFAEGPEALKPGHSGTQEYAVLRNDYARLFFDTVSALEKQYMPESRAHKLEESRLMPGEVRITHSCYPRNLRRWMNDTISRKQRCRAELCALIWCWYASWLEEVKSGIIDKSLVDHEIANIYLYSDDSQQIFQKIIMEKHISNIRVWLAADQETLLQKKAGRKKTFQNTMN